MLRKGLPGYERVCGAGTVSPDSGHLVNSSSNGRLFSAAAAKRRLLKCASPTAYGYDVDDSESQKRELGSRTLWLAGGEHQALR